MLTAQQMQKHTQQLFSSLYATDAYDPLKQLLFQWKEHHKSPSYAITTFLKILQLISNSHPDLLDDLNRCLLKQYCPFSTPPTLDRLKTLASENPNALPILDTVLIWLRTEQPPQTNGAPPSRSQLQELTEIEFVLRLERHEKSREIAKIIMLYRKCILTISQFKKQLEPIYLTDPSFFNMLFQYAEELEERRRKITIFAPLNELVDQKYPLQQVGNSYIVIPEGYANWGGKWATNALENVLNRVYVSVPLGTEGSFVITRKNEYEEQLLKNQEEKYEIDSNLVSLKAAINIIQKTKKFNHPLVLKILSTIYTAEVVGIMLRSVHAEVARVIVLPRLRQKLAELTRCRGKFQKSCEEIASKNFYKSLDYRCFYFCKNDKKFNCPARWEKQIQMRKREVIEEQLNHSQLQIQDRDSLQHSRHYTLNSFDNITTQELLQIKSKEFSNGKKEGIYPPYPHNQVLFLIDFEDKDTLNDVFEVLLHHTQKKTLLQLLVFKMFKKSINRKLQKASAVLQYLEGKGGDWEQPTNDQLNQVKSNKRVYKDLTDQFLELIQEDIQAVRIEDQEFPFEGPEEHTFIGTKHCYFFIRYLVTIYHRFLRAKSLSNERGSKQDQPSLYSQYLSVLIHKIKEQKGMEEFLRRIFQQDAYIFFTMDKLILGEVKLINNINVDSLTYKILKDDVKDYDLQIRRWTDYQHPTVTEQLTRLYRERQMLFRFSYSSQEELFYVSAWENGMTFDADRKRKEGEGSIEKNIFSFMTDPVYYSKEGPQGKCHQEVDNEYFQDQHSNLLMRGEESLVGKRRAAEDLKGFEMQLCRLRKLRIL